MKYFFNLFLILTFFLFFLYFLRRYFAQRRFLKRWNLFIHSRIKVLLWVSLFCLFLSFFGFYLFGHHGLNDSSQVFRQRPVFFVLDCSKSMLVKQQFKYAKELSGQILRTYPSSSSALIGYGSNAFLFVPPTQSLTSSESAFAEISPDSEWIEPGSDPSQAFFLIEKLIQSNPGTPVPLVLLFTDGVNTANAYSSAWRARNFPVIVFLTGKWDTPQAILQKDGTPLLDPETNQPVKTAPTEKIIRPLLKQSRVPWKILKAPDFEESQREISHYLIWPDRHSDAPYLVLLFAAIFLLILVFFLPRLFRITPAHFLFLLLTATLLQANETHDYAYWRNEMRKNPGDEKIAQNLENSWIQKCTPLPQKKAAPQKETTTTQKTTAKTTTDTTNSAHKNNPIKTTPKEQPSSVLKTKESSSQNQWTDLLKEQPKVYKKQRNITKPW